MSNSVFGCSASATEGAHRFMMLFRTVLLYFASMKFCEHAPAQKASLELVYGHRDFVGLR